MTAPRINIAWIVVGILMLFVLFFVYHILRTMISNSSTKNNEAKLIEEQTNNAPFFIESQEHNTQVEAQTTGSEYATPSDHDEPAHDLPDIIGQTKEEIMNPDPLQQKNPAYRYNKPQAIDTYSGQPHMEAEFGDNLRHPESMFEPSQQQQSSYISSSGIGSHTSSPGNHYAIGYASENAQNAGEFMNGIYAFDNSFEGPSYSAL